MPFRAEEDGVCAVAYSVRLRTFKARMDKSCMLGCLMLAAIYEMNIDHAGLVLLNSTLLLGCGSEPRADLLLP